VRTSPTSLLGWMEAPPSGVGMRFLEGDAVVDVSYEQLAADARRFAEGLAPHLDEPGARVVLVIPKPREFAVAVFGTLWAGGCAVPVAAPLPLQKPVDYAAHLGPIVAASGPALVVHADDCLDGHETDFPNAAFASVLAAGEDEGERAAALHDGPVVLQFTSGSTGNPKGVRVSAHDIETQARLFDDWMQFTTDDRVTGWMPMHHDFGLVGTLMIPAIHGMGTVLSDPLSFARKPASWLDAFSVHGATITMAPPIGFDMAAKAMTKWTGDLSRWRVAVCGAEPIDPLVMTRFVRAAAPFGFDPKALSSGYGMAEATLGVAGGPFDRIERCVHVADDVRPAFGARLDIDETRTIAEIEPGDLGWITSQGTAFTDVRLRIVDDDGVEVPEDVVGQLVITTPSRSTGYHGDDNPRYALDDWLETGDAGFLHDGELYILGRIADRLKVRGQALAAEDLEIQLVRRAGVHPRSVLVLPALHAGAQGVTVFWEGEGNDDEQETVAALESATRLSCGQGIEVTVVVVPRGSIPRTTSGKPRRRRAWMDLQASIPATQGGPADR
jgi:acyl-CoA synthetase (AMP-forming)/AMP-acid ligase II